MTHLAWVPAEWHEAAVDTLAGLGERHPSRGILLFPEPSGGRRDRREGLGARLPAARGAAPRRGRGHRAHAARAARVGAGQHRHAAPGLRPARLPPLARRAPLRRARARADGRRLRSARRRFASSGTTRPVRTGSSSRSSSRRPSRTSRGGVPGPGDVRSPGSGPELPRQASCASPGRRPRRCCWSAGCGRGSVDRSSWCTRPPLGSSRWPWTARTSRSRARNASSSSDLLSAELDELSRDEIYEEAVRAPLALDDAEARLRDAE